MPGTETHMTLSYQVTITRADGDNWPPATASPGFRYDVTKVRVRVSYEDGELRAHKPLILRGRYLRKDGTPGADLSGKYTAHAYQGEQDDDPANQKAAEMRMLALHEAWVRHTDLTGDDVPRIFSEEAFARDRAAFLAERQD